ncbi:MAG: drug:proton antiporter [Neomegalonema sp.]|nr:drug:proton antiporter [Neomegalonema sp.]
MSLFSDLSLASRFARRELRGGLASFRVFLACLILGVAGIAGVGSVVAAIEAGLAREGASLLGGDAQIDLTYRFASDEERAQMASVGQVSEVVDFRGMTRTEAGETALVQAKAVDAAYPLYGQIVLEPPMSLSAALAPAQDGTPGAVAETALLTRLGLVPGDQVKFGDQIFEIRAAIAQEPDRAAGGFQFGPRFLFSSRDLPRTGLVQPGTLYETEYRIALPEGTDLDALQKRWTRQYADAGWRWRDKRNGAPGVRRFVRRLGAFLTLVGLAALAVGGVGVGASIRAYLERKTDTIATLKTIGASGRVVMLTYLLQIAVLTGIGVLGGVLLGALIPIAFAPLLAQSLPVPTSFGFYPEPLLQAAVYGGLTAFAFALWPLARAQRVRAAGLFRDLVAPQSALPSPTWLLAIAALAGGLAMAAIFFTRQPDLAGWFVVGVAGALILLRLAAWAVAALSRMLARTRLGRVSLPMRLALSSLGGPSGEARGTILALGLGLSVLTAIGLIDYNLRSAITQTLPEKAPSYFFLDIQNADLPHFVAQAEQQPGVERLETAPMLRGIITRINGQSIADWRKGGHVEPGFGWVLRGDRGVSYAAALPDGAELVEGEWWEEGYEGPPLVSFGEEQGRGIGLSLGDEITVNILGRDVTARVANFRKVEFREGGINFLMIYTPGTLRGAPHVHLATLYGEEPAPGTYMRAIASAFPAVSAIRVEDAIKTFASILRDVATAARVGALATLITGLVVLIGAAAAGQRRQIQDAAILKTLGATRAGVLGAMSLRALLMGLAAAIVALLTGTLGAWAVVTFVFEADFRFDLFTALWVILGGILATILTGALFALGPLSARPARVLRARE